MCIDFSSHSEYRRIHGVNMGPLCLNGIVDLSEYHRRAAFPTVRLHDCTFYYADAVDVPCIFPLFHLSLDDPRNYRFARTDAYLKSIVDCGARIVYRLGIAIQCHPVYRFDTDPPADYDRWADICIRIIRHYNEGWANGFRYGIRYWEIWNEPEIGPGMWNASYDEYFRFYIRVAKRIKVACPDIMIGGPAFNGSFLTNWDKMHAFLPAIRKEGAPLDFCSWHAYPERPGQLPVAAANVRRLLDEYGYERTESHLNEWNLAPYRGLWSRELALSHPHTTEYVARKKGVEGGAMAAACLIALQDAPVDMANFYDAANGPWGMFDQSGLPAKPYYAFLAFREMLERTPCRCRVEGSDPDEGLALLAGRSADGATLQIMACNFQSPQMTYAVECLGLPEGTSYRVSHRRMDVHTNLDYVGESSFTAGSESLRLAAPPHSVHLLTLRRIYGR
ncbi:MAG: hypothetical protein PHR35_15395 [Kiritimatiellae bacterium]|nr:hypothetical protein [Kiritimatiellia bacterium]